MPGELPRVAERLEVERDDRVAGSSSSSSSRSLPLTSALLPSETKLETPMPAAPAGRAGAMPERAGLRRDGERDRGRRAGAKSRPAGRRIGVQHAEAVRARPGGRRRPRPVPQQLALARRRRRPSLAEPGRKHHGRGARRRRPHRAITSRPRAGTATTTRSTGSGSASSRVRARPPTRCSRAVHRVDRPRKPPGEMLPAPRRPTDPGRWRRPRPTGAGPARAGGCDSAARSRSVAAWCGRSGPARS